VSIGIRVFVEIAAVHKRYYVTGIYARNRVQRPIRARVHVNGVIGDLVVAETDIEEACQIAERLRVAVNVEPCMWQEDGQSPLPIPVTTSIGVAVYPLHGTTRELLITSADQAMYRAKKTGRNRVCIADLEKDTMEQQNPSPSDPRISETEAIQALTAAASAHDGGTHDHAQRMIQLAEETARYLGRSEEEVHLIRLAALLHDIGKIGIPDTILHKPGPLTSDEWQLCAHIQTLDGLSLSKQAVFSVYSLTSLWLIMNAGTVLAIQPNSVERIFHLVRVFSRS